MILVLNLYLLRLFCSFLFSGFKLRYLMMDAMFLSYPVITVKLSFSAILEVACYYQYFVSSFCFDTAKCYRTMLSGQHSKYNKGSILDVREIHQMRELPGTGNIECSRASSRLVSRNSELFHSSVLHFQKCDEIAESLHE